MYLYIQTQLYIYGVKRVKIRVFVIVDKLSDYSTIYINIVYSVIKNKKDNYTDPTSFSSPAAGDIILIESLIDYNIMNNGIERRIGLNLKGVIMLVPISIVIPNTPYLHPKSTTWSIHSGSNMCCHSLTIHSSQWMDGRDRQLQYVIAA